MSQTLTDHQTSASFMKQTGHRSHSINPQGGVTQRQNSLGNHSSGRMRELIVTNFMKKYLSQSDPEGDVTTGFYVRLTKALGDFVDSYLSDSSKEKKSVRLLEDSLWDIARSQSKMLPSIDESKSGALGPIFRQQKARQSVFDAADKRMTMGEQPPVSLFTNRLS
jgi:hypothetical protein